MGGERYHGRLELTWTNTDMRLLAHEDAITLSVRLQIGDLPILWNGADREYNPDFIAVDRAGIHWIVEAKMDKEMASADIQGKRVAAQKWSNYVSAGGKVGTGWRYLLASETDVTAARGSWPALAKLGGY